MLVASRLDRHMFQTSKSTPWLLPIQHIGFGAWFTLWAKLDSAALQAKRGTPCYMAPELFQDGSTHSSAADLWALGCVLYECAAGHPPFVSTSFNHLVNDILTSNPAVLPSKLPISTNNISFLGSPP